MSKVKWNMDPTHSELGFKVKHMMVTNLSGKFSDFNIQAASDDEQFSNPEISFSAKIASVNTGQEQRDTHLRSAEFFDAEVHPEMTNKRPDTENDTRCTKANLLKYRREQSSTATGDDGNYFPHQQDYTARCHNSAGCCHVHKRQQHSDSMRC